MSFTWIVFSLLTFGLNGASVSRTAGVPRGEHLVYQTCNAKSTIKYSQSFTSNAAILVKFKFNTNHLHIIPVAYDRVRDGKCKI